jgi:signal peptidase II
MSRTLRLWLPLILIIAAVLLVDQLSKRYIVDNLYIGETVQPIKGFAPFFQLTRSENTGSAFGFLPQAGDVFLVIAIVVVIGMIIFYPRMPEQAVLSRFALGLVCGGALGNAFDRIQYGAVVDFIHYQLPGVISNVSNLADHAIVIGVLIIFFESWRYDPKKQEQTETPEVPEPHDPLP